MDNLYLVILVIIGGVFVLKRLKRSVLKAENQVLVKEDETLKKQQLTLEQEITKVKETLNKPVADLTPEQVEDFWKDNKK